MRPTSLHRGTVIVVQRLLPHYRVAFFERLDEVLRADEIGFRVLYGGEFPGTVPRTVDISAPWAVRIRNRYLRIGERELVWQDCLDQTRNADLVIVEHAKRLLVNYVLIARRAMGGPKLAFWGHGANRDEIQVRPRRSTVAGITARAADHWFAYTEDSLPDLAALGVTADRITTVHNAIDTEELTRAAENWTAADLEAVRGRLGVPRHPVGLYCGSLYAAKKIPFLLDAADRIREHLPEFHLIVVGDGPEAGLIRAAGESRTWLHYVGPRFGPDRVPYFLLADLVLAPGAVGLNVLDAIALGVPMATTRGAAHGPEIAYLAHDRNGLILDGAPEDFARQAVALLSDPDRLRALSDRCAADRKIVTLDRMVHCFAEGVHRALRGRSS